MTQYENPRSFVPVIQRDKFDDDRVSLLEVWEAVVRRKRVLFSAVAASVLVGLVLVVGWPAQEQISTVIEIGTRVIDNGIAPIETPQTALVKINEGYIPLARNEYAKNHPDRKFVRIKASIPRNGDVIVLESRAHPTEEAFQIQQHLHVVKLLQQDHDRVLSLIRNELQQRLKQGENSLAGLRGDRTLLLAGVQRIEERSVLIQAEIKEVERLLQSTERSWNQAVDGASNPPAAMAQLLITNDLQQNRTKLAAMKENVLIALPGERDRLQKAIEDNQRAQEERKAAVENIRMRLTNLRETRPLGGGPLPNPTAVQPRKSVILSISLLVGALLGILAAILVDVIDRARGEAKTRSTLVSQAVCVPAINVDNAVALRAVVP